MSIDVCIQLQLRRLLLVEGKSSHCVDVAREAHLNLVQSISQLVLLVGVNFLARILLLLDEVFESIFEIVGEAILVIGWVE